MATLEQEGEEVVGQARCPFESRQSNVGLFAGERGRPGTRFIPELSLSGSHGFIEVKHGQKHYYSNDRKRETVTLEAQMPFTVSPRTPLIHFFFYVF